MPFDPYANFGRPKVTPSEPGLISKGLHAVGSVLGAPKAGIDYLYRLGARAQGLNVADDATVGQALRAGFGLSQGDEGYAGHLLGKAIEFGGDLAFDPLTYASFGTGRLGKVATGAFAGLGGVGAYEEGSRAIDTIRHEGFTPQAAEELLGAGLSAGGAGLAGYHLAGGRKAAPAIERAGLPDVYEGNVPPEFRRPEPGRGDIYLGEEPGPLNLREPAPLDLGPGPQPLDLGLSAPPAQTPVPSAPGRPKLPGQIGLDFGGTPAIERAGAPEPLTAPNTLFDQRPQGQPLDIYLGDLADDLARAKLPEPPPGAAAAPPGPPGAPGQEMAPTPAIEAPAAPSGAIEGPAPGTVDPNQVPPVGQVKPPTIYMPDTPKTRMGLEASGRPWTRDPKMERAFLANVEPLKLAILENPQLTARDVGMREEVFNAVRDAVHAELAERAGLPAIERQPPAAAIEANAPEPVPVAPAPVAPKKGRGRRGQKPVAVPPEVVAAEAAAAPALAPEPTPVAPEVPAEAPVAAAPPAVPQLRGGRLSGPPRPGGSATAAHTVDAGEGFQLLTRPKSPTFSLRGPMGEKVTGRIQPDRIEFESIGKGTDEISAPDSRSGVAAMRRLAQMLGKPLYFVSQRLSPSGGEFRSRMLERGELLKTPEGLLLRGTGPDVGWLRERPELWPWFQDEPPADVGRLGRTVGGDPGVRDTAAAGVDTPPWYRSRGSAEPGAGGERSAEGGATGEGTVVPVGKRTGPTPSGGQSPSGAEPGPAGDANAAAGPATAAPAPAVVPPAEPAPAPAAAPPEAPAPTGLSDLGALKRDGSPEALKELASRRGDLLVDPETRSAMLKEAKARGFQPKAKTTRAIFDEMVDFASKEMGPPAEALAPGESAPGESTVPVEVAPAARSPLQEAGDAAWESMMERGREMGKKANLGAALTEAPGLFKDLAVYGASLIERGVRSFPEWSKAMQEKLGGVFSGLGEHLQRIYQDAMETFTRTAKQFGHTFLGVGESQGPPAASERGAVEFGKSTGPTTKLGGKGAPPSEPPKAPPTPAAPPGAPPPPVTPGGATPAAPGAPAATPSLKTAAERAADIGFEHWTSGLVSGLGTPISNVASGALETTSRATEAGVAPFVDSLLTKLHGGERTRYSGEATAQIKGGLAALPRAFRTVLDGLTNIWGAENEGAIPGKYGKVVRSPLMALKIGDAGGRAVNEGAVTPSFALREARRQLPNGSRAQIEALQQQLISNPTPELAEAIRKEVDSRQFKMGDNPRSLVKFITNMRAQHPWMKVIFPFVETPAAIADLTLQRSPAGFWEAGKAYNAWLKASKAGAPPEVLARLKGEAVDKITRPLVGTMILGTFAAIAKSGRMTGSGPEDPKAKAALRESGWQPYSFVYTADDGTKTYVPYGRFEPVSGLLGWAADLSEAKDSKNANELFNKAVGSIGQNLLSKTYLSGLADAASAAANPKEAGAKYVANLAGSLVPNIVAKAAQAIDPTVRDVTEETGLAGLPSRVANTVQSRLPFLSQQLPPRRSGTGQLVTREGSPLSRFAAPFQVSTQEPGNLQQTLVDIGAVPSPPQEELVIPGSKGKKVKLTQEELDVLTAADAKASEYLRRVVQSPTFRNMDPEAQKAAVERIYGQYRQTARQRLYRTPGFAGRARVALREARA